MTQMTVNVSIAQPIDENDSNDGNDSNDDGNDQEIGLNDGNDGNDSRIETMRAKISPNPRAR